MKKRGKRKSGVLKSSLVCLLAVFALGRLGLAALPGLSPLVSSAALFSAALTMPEQAAKSLLTYLGEPAGTVPAASPEQGALSKPAGESSASLTGENKSGLAAIFAPEQRAHDSGSSAPPKEETPDAEIPEKYKGEVREEDFSGETSNSNSEMDGFWIRNDTALGLSELKSVLQTPMQLKIADINQPQVLIYHTHATESFNPYDDGVYDTRYNWRSTDNNNNMVAVGAVMAEVLRENGIEVIHDTEQHDYPSYNGSYANSYRSMKDYLTRYPSIKVTLDLHRDAIERNNRLIVKPTCEIDGEKYAQLMIVSNCDDGSGLLPNWRENLRFASAFARQLESDYPPLARPVLFSYRKYNQQLSTGALLLEFGTHANTLEEAKRTARAAGESLSRVLLETK